MNVKTDQTGGVSIVRVGEARLMYPILSDFSAAVSALVAAGKREILIDLSPVTYVDSATIGCLMDLYRQTPQALGRPEARRDDADHDRRAELHRDSRRRADGRQEFRGLACAPSKLPAAPP